MAVAPEQQLPPHCNGRQWMKPFLLPPSALSLQLPAPPLPVTLTGSLGRNHSGLSAGAWRAAGMRAECSQQQQQQQQPFQQEMRTVDEEAENTSADVV